MVESKYLEFYQTQVGDNRKTEIWNVYSKSSSSLLGQIKWFGRWRQYCFWPSRDTIFNPKCLMDINSAIYELMDIKRTTRLQALTSEREGDGG